MIDPAKVCLFIPAGLKKFKLDLFERIGRKIEKAGGQVIRHQAALLDQLKPDVIPIVGCMAECTGLISKWRQLKRPWIYWDRGYARRVFATWLPRGENGGFYRWHLGSFQLRALRDVPDDRWRVLKTEVLPWQKGGRHIVLAQPTLPYSKFHALSNWTDVTLDALARVTDRQIIIRCKESKRPLQADIEGAHALVAHGSIAAVEAAICGCPVFVDPSSAAALIGQVDLGKIEQPIYPDRDPWMRSLGYSQFNEQELVDGTLWRLIA